MHLTAIERIDSISAADFRNTFYREQKPVIIRNMAHEWPAYNKWTWDYLKSLVGDVKVGVYNNIRAGAHVPVNGADDTMLFGDYIDLIQRGPAELRIFLFNIFKAAPHITSDFSFPHAYLRNMLTKFPMLFVGGAGSIAHMHYDIDLSHIFHTQFIGRKQVLLLANDQSPFIYRMPSTVESAANFVNWYYGLDEDRFPALRHASAYHAVLEHGDTLFMPSGYWHHMEYLESGMAMSLRAIPEGVTPKLNGLYHILGMRCFNNMLIKMAPEWWYHHKRKVAHRNAEKAVAAGSGMSAYG